ncbi:MAG: hypothetical protein C0403_19240 [Desulfobacterium sp.]|nr:hypothetical protein [Desulfobacterium sp.]
MIEESSLVKPCNRNIKATIKLTDFMIRLASRGDADREDVGCGVLYGVMLDAAFKIRKLAEKEKNSHKDKGWWDENR